MSHGNLPAAILGSEDFDVEQIDISSIQLSRADKVGGSVAPMEGPPGPHSVLDDVGTPFDGEACDCHDLAGDGITDLLMHFETQALVSALELNDLEPGSFVELTITGTLLNGKAFATGTSLEGTVFSADTSLDDSAFSFGTILAGTTFTATDCIRLVPAGDMNGDGLTGLEDLLIMFAAWGNCTHCIGCDADLDGDCTVGVSDLMILMADWGA